MRRIAGGRYQRGEMPEWFKPEWLDVEEAPMNSFWRQQGLELYQHDSTWMGDGGNFGGPGGWSSLGKLLWVLSSTTCSHEATAPARVKSMNAVRALGTSYAACWRLRDMQGWLTQTVS